MRPATWLGTAAAMLSIGLTGHAQTECDRACLTGYPVVDTERGIVLSIVRFGLREGRQSQSPATANDRLVGEFFVVKSGMIQEIHAVLFNLPDSEPTGWEPDYGPGRGGW